MYVTNLFPYYVHVRTIAVSVNSTDGGGGEESPRSARNLKSHFRRKKFQSPQLRTSVEAILQPAPSSLVADLL